MTFNTLLAQLGISKAYKDETQLARVEQWCYENISRDIRYQGRSLDKYTLYLTLMKNYLDRFLKFLPDNLSKQLVEFNDMNAVQYAAQHGYERFISADKPISHKMLDKQNHVGMSPLHLGAINGHSYTVRALLEKGANPRLVNKELQLPIHCALMIPMQQDDQLMHTKMAVFKMLFQQAPDVLYNKNASGNTVFHLMAIHGFDELLAEYLAKNNQGAFLSNNHSHYPIHSAILNNQPSIVRLLLTIPQVHTQADAQHRVALHYAASYGTDKTLQTCISASHDINIRDDREKTPLLLAAEYNQLHAVQSLIHHGANATLTDDLGYSILHYAVFNQNEPLIRWILDNTMININQVDAEGSTVLLHAQRFHNNSIETILVNKGAKIENLKPNYP